MFKSRERFEIEIVNICPERELFCVFTSLARAVLQKPLLCKATTALSQPIKGSLKVDGHECLLPTLIFMGISS